MHKCFKCGTEFEGGFCPECGTQWQEEKQCPNCGATLAGSAKFCNECGYSFVETEEKKPKKTNPTMQKIGAFFVNVWVWIKSHLKIVVPTACALVVLIVMLSLIPTFIVASVNGTYYTYSFDENGELAFNEKTFVKLNTGKWTDETGKEGKYTLSGSEITLTYEDEDLKELGAMFGEDVSMEIKGTVKNGILTLVEDKHEKIFVSKSHKHKFGEWEETKAVTCTEEGERFHTCACKKVETGTIAALGHDYGSDHICTRCKDKTGHILDEKNQCTVCKKFYIDGVQIEYYEYNEGHYAVTGLESDLSEIVIPSTCNGESVTHIRYQAFKDCSGLTSITIPNSVTSIGQRAFFGCSGLTSITIPNSVTSIEYRAFEGCSGLTSITIPNSVTSIGSNAFWGCSGLIQTENGVRYVDKWVIGCDQSIPSVTLRTDTVGIADDAFDECSGLTSITIPNSVTNIGSSAFYGCSGLTSITIPDGVTSIRDYAFYRCSGLTRITIPNSVTSIGYSAFYNCSGLTSITIPNSVTSIGSYAFEGCNGLTSITIPNSVTSIGADAFEGCNGLTSITIPNSVTSIGRYAFGDCSGLNNIQFEGTKAQWEAIKKGEYWNSYTGDYTVQCTDGKLDKNGNEVA